MILAADIGGTKMASALIDEHGELVSKVLQTPTSASEGAASILEATIGLLLQLEGPGVDLAKALAPDVVGVTGGLTQAGPWWQKSLRKAYAAQLLRTHQPDECAPAEFRFTGRVLA